MNKEINLSEGLSNHELLNMSYEHGVIGFDYGVYWDQDLEDYLMESGIKIGNAKYFRELTYNEDGEISNFSVGETVGYVSIVQNDEERQYRLFCSKEMLDSADIYIDFSTSYESIPGIAA